MLAEGEPENLSDFAHDGAGTGHRHLSSNVGWDCSREGAVSRSPTPALCRPPQGVSENVGIGVRNGSEQVSGMRRNPHPTDRRSGCSSTRLRRASTRDLVNVFNDYGATNALAYLTHL